MVHFRIAVTGSTGLIGTALVRSLRADGHDVVRLVRRPARAGDEVEWDPKRGYVDGAGLVGCDAVVHLAGAGVGDHRWTEAYKQEIRDSRVLGTEAIAQAVASLDVPPKVLLSGSAIGYYGDTGDRAVDESAPHGEGFLPSVCVEWEAAAAPAEEAGVRTVFARTGLVVGREGGAWGGCSRCSGRDSAGGSATGTSTGVSSRCTTTSPPCGTSSIRRRCRDR